MGYLSPQPTGPPWEMPKKWSRKLTWVGQVDLLRDSPGSHWGPLDSQGENQEQTAGTKGAHGKGTVWGADGEVEGSTVDQIPSGTAQRGWEDGEWREIRQRRGGRQDSGEVFKGMVIQMLERKQKY